MLSAQQRKQHLLLVQSATHVEDFLKRPPLQHLQRNAMVGWIWVQIGQPALCRLSRGDADGDALVTLSGRATKNTDPTRQTSPGIIAVPRSEHRARPNCPEAVPSVYFCCVSYHTRRIPGSETEILLVFISDLGFLLRQQENTAKNLLDAGRHKIGIKIPFHHEGQDSRQAMARNSIHAFPNVTKRALSCIE